MVIKQAKYELIFVYTKVHNLISQDQYSDSCSTEVIQMNKLADGSRSSFVVLTKVPLPHTHMAISFQMVAVVVLATPVTVVSCHCRHLIFAPSARNQYAGLVFLGVVHAMFEATSFAGW